MWAALRAAGVGRRAAAAVAGYLAQLRAGRAVCGGRSARARSPRRPTAVAVAAIAALIAALVGVRLASSWAAGRLAIDGGGVLRERLLHGLLRLDTESMRAAGIGQLLGRVVETEAVESLALGGGLIAAAGAFELVTGARASWRSASRPAAQLGVARRLVRSSARCWRRGFSARSARWSARARLALTHDLVERMVGQRTLVAQQPRDAAGTASEDAALARYARDGRALDRAVAVLAIVAAARLAGRGRRGARAAAVRRPAARPGAFATSLGGMLLVYGALRKLAQAFPALGAAAIAWRQVAAMFAAPPARRAGAPPRRVAGRAAGGRHGADQRARPRLPLPGPRRAGAVRTARCDIRRGDRVLLEGPSGGGKSTLGALLAGLRVPDAGRCRWRRRSAATLGLDALARARRRGAAVPREPRLLASLLLQPAAGPRLAAAARGRRRGRGDLRELDLGPLLARMPSGLEQLVGESGWQLSHGERSRLFIARALLQPLDAARPGRELRRAGSRDAGARARLRARARGDAGRHRASLVGAPLGFSLGAEWEGEPLGLREQAWNPVGRKRLERPPTLRPRGSPSHSAPALRLGSATTGLQ